jgi:hypothetical protein
MRSLLSRLAREIKVVRVSGIVSGLRGCGLRRSPGSAELRRAAFPPRKKFRAVARAEFLPPYSRAAATVLHRLPGTESAVSVAERFEWRRLQPVGVCFCKDQTPQAEARATEPSEFRGCCILSELKSMAPTALQLKKSVT